MVDHHPVVLLGHRPVEAAQPGLDVDERDVPGVGGPAAAGQRELLVRVAHPDADLDGAGVGAAERLVVADLGEGARVEPAVGVDHADHHAGAVGGLGQPGGDLPVGGVEGGALADPGVRAAALDEVDARVVGRGGEHQLAGGVLAVVVDHPQVGLGRSGPQAVQGLGDHRLLVAAGDHQVPLEGGRVAGLGGAVVLEGVAGAGPVHEEAPEDERQVADEGQGDQSGDPDDGVLAKHDPVVQGVGHGAMLLVIKG